MIINTSRWQVIAFIKSPQTINLAFNIGNSPFNKALGKYVIYSWDFRVMVVQQIIQLQTFECTIKVSQVNTAHLYPNICHVLPSLFNTVIDNISTTYKNDCLYCMKHCQSTIAVGYSVSYWFFSLNHIS